MLHRLTVSNLAVVEKAEAEFAPGLNILTGETGAGKSVLRGALEFVLGGKADGSVVRDGAPEAEVEAVFEVERKGGGGERVTIRRTVTDKGRSRAWVNDESVSVAELRALGAGFVDVHGSRASQSLLEERFQRETLDSFGGCVKENAAYASAWSAAQAIRGEIAALESSVPGGNVADELDFLRFQVGELDAAELSDADETLETRHAAAAHAGEIVEIANAVTETLGGERGVEGMLAALQPEFRRMAKHFAAAGDWAEEAEDLTTRVQELSRAVADATSRMDAGDGDFEELDRRLTLVSKLKRKYRIPDVAGLLSLLEKKRARLETLEHYDERLEALRASLARSESEIAAAGKRLTAKRNAAAGKLAKSVTAELHDLGFLQAKFAIRLDPIAPESHGADRVVYLFEPNPGESARELAAIASSGEIARVMLAIKVVSCGVTTSNSQPTLVFDEIDANIGGEVGRIVGEKMRAVARHYQVIAITHLPQSAVYGERHLVVSKSVAAGRTRTRISEVEGEDRVSEIARMLGGEKLTTVVRKHAKELLELSR